MGRRADGGAARVHKDQSAWEARSRLWRFRRRLEPPIRATEHMSGANSTSLSSLVAWTLPVHNCGCRIALYRPRLDQHAMSYPVDLCNIARNSTTSNTSQPPVSFASAICDPETRRPSTFVEWRNPRYLDIVGDLSARLPCYKLDGAQPPQKWKPAGSWQEKSKLTNHAHPRTLASHIVCDDVDKVQDRASWAATGGPQARRCTCWVFCTA